MPIQITHLKSLGIAMLFACALPAFAQQAEILLPQDEEEVTIQEQNSVDNRYRIGIDCSPAPEMLRVHLRLPEDTGLVVNAVMGDSPAGRAGVKRFDIIVEANGQPVSSVSDLVRAVNKAGDSEMPLAVIHKGEERLLTITPELRSEEEIQQLQNRMNPFGRMRGGPWPPGLEDELRRAMQQLDALPGLPNMPNIPNLPQLGNGFRQLRPGIVLDLDEDIKQLPDGFNLKMQVERDGSGPAKIKIERGNDSWEVTENDLGELPDDVRPMVENMLNGNRLGMRGLQGRIAPRMPARPKSPLPPRKADQRIEDRFDGLELKMQELRDAIESIQGDK